jgi:acid phosphatase family membrane protein YuiD
MNSFYSMIKSPVFLSALFSWIISQVLKSIIHILRQRPRSARTVILHLLWATGGMPSSHSAVVAALATSVGFVVGVQSPFFALTLFYGFITIRDALGVRRAAGSQAIVLNQLIHELSHQTNITLRTVKEVHGHRFSEVIVGVLLGFFIAVAFCNL